MKNDHKAGLKPLEINLNACGYAFIVDTFDAASPAFDILGLIHRLSNQWIPQDRVLMTGKEILRIDLFREKSGIIDFDAILVDRHLITLGISEIPMAKRIPDRFRNRPLRDLRDFLATTFA